MASLSLHRLYPVFLAAAILIMAGQVMAVPVNASLEYSCVFPLIEEQPLSVEITADMPEIIAPGQSTGAFQIQANAQVSAESWNGLSFVGTHALAGKVEAQSSISGQGVDLPLTLPMTITDKTLPDEIGAFTVAASGETPPLTFTEANQGEVNIRVGDLVMFLQPRDGNGNPTGLGDFESECTLMPGQDDVLHTLTVTGSNNTEQDFEFAGESLIKEGVVLPLKGMLQISSTAAGSSLSGELQLEDSSIDVSIIRFFKTLSLDARVSFDTVGELGGTVSNGNMIVQQAVSMTLNNLRLKVFGFPISQSNGQSCTTGEPVALSLSTPAGESFDPLTGGRLTGKYTLPAFAGCGVMTELVNLFLAGPDNTLNIMMSPQS